MPGLDDAELRALMMAQPRVIGDVPLAAAAERALDKLVAAMPVSLRARAAFIRQRLYVDTAGWRGAVEELRSLPVVQDAVSRDRKLFIRYQKPKGEISERTVDPLGLVAKGPAWYLVANTAEGFRTFRVSRIEKATMLELAVDRPPDFDLAAHWKSSTKAFREKRGRYTVTMLVDRGTVEKLIHWVGASVIQPSQDAPDGWVTLRAELEDEEHACFMMLGLGDRVEILEPAALRERVVASAASIVAKSGRRARS